jgi:hypothetical protein
MLTNNLFMVDKGIKGNKNLAAKGGIINGGINSKRQGDSGRR